jgi:acetyl-CoA carboxylase biotin carboxylase subunit
LARLHRALGELIIDGVDSSVPLFRALLQEKDVLTGEYNIHWLEKFLAKSVES